MVKVGIVGLGLIGGSLGIDLRHQGFKVLGVARQRVTCQIAKHRKIVDKADFNLDILAKAEIIFICTPIDAIVPTLERIIPYISADTIVTDVGSVKESIVRTCSGLWPNFVGGHPMAGTAEQGIDAAQANLFQGAAYVFTPIESTPPAAVSELKAIARSLGCVTYTCSPEEHDRAVAWISHLPVTISASLIKACIGETSTSVADLARKLASSGFRDTSRVGGGNPELGKMMAQYNRDNLLRSLGQYRDSLTQFIEAIDREDWASLEKLLESTRQARSEFI
jgi:arogenate dehydrogenase (NADP+)